MRRVVFDQCSWGHIAVHGEDRVRFLNGMVTGNIQTLGEGQWLRTMMLTHKARVVSIFEVHAYADHLLVSCQPELMSTTMETLDRHIVMDDVDLEKKSLTMHTVWDTIADVWSAPPEFSKSSQPSSSLTEVICRRIEAGMPHHGTDVSEDNFPFESELIRLIDYEKGCFAGQEPVSRVHHRGGGGSKRLLGLVVDGEDLLTVGSLLSTTKKTKGGVVTSVALSEQFGSIALAYVHKSAWDSGSEVEVGGRRARVVSLPFS